METLTHSSQQELSQQVSVQETRPQSASEIPRQHVEEYLLTEEDHRIISQITEPTLVSDIKYKLGSDIDSSGFFARLIRSYNVHIVTTANGERYIPGIEIVEDEFKNMRSFDR